MRRDPLTNTLEAYFLETSVPLVCAYLFGSRARGAHAPDSDVDVAVLLPEDVRPGLLGPSTTLRGDLERLIRLEVDLIDMRHAPVDLVHRILRDGHLLVDRSPRDRVSFEVQARNEYFDLLPHLHRYRRGQVA